MADETTIAFEHPLARAVATSGPDPLDRIAVRDYVKSVEIGAFQAERGVTQRVRFNVVLEVAHHAAAQDDDVDKVLSYDTIVEAIDDQLATERINLLETLAEGIAERCLKDRRAIRAFVRVEKLDRIPGSLCVEIMRRRVAETADVEIVHDVAANRSELADVHQPIVVFVPNAVIDDGSLTAWLDAINALSHPAILSLEAAPVALPDASGPVARRIGLLAIEQNGWLLAGLDDRCVVVATRTELDWAAKHDQMSVWAPSKIVLDATERPGVDARNPRRLAQWFAQEIEAASLIILGDATGLPPSDIPQFDVPLSDPTVLAQLKMD